MIIVVVTVMTMNYIQLMKSAHWDVHEQDESRLGKSEMPHKATILINQSQIIIVMN